MNSNIRNILKRALNRVCYDLTHDGVTLFCTITDNADGHGIIRIYGYGTDADLIKIRLCNAANRITGEAYGCDDEDISEGRTDPLFPEFKTVHIMINF